MIEIPDFIDDVPFGIEIAEGLIVVADLHVVAVGDGATDWLKPARERFEQRRFSGAIRSHDGVALAAANRHRQVVDDRPVVAGREAIGGERDRARTRSGVELERGERLIMFGTFELIETAEHLAS